MFTRWKAQDGELFKYMATPHSAAVVSGPCVSKPKDGFKSTQVYKTRRGN